MQCAANQELGAEVVDLLRAGGLADAAGSAAALENLVTDHHGQRLIDLLVGRFAQIAAETGAQLFEELGLDGLDALLFKLH